MHLVPAPAVRLMKRRVLSRPGINSLVHERELLIPFWDFIILLTASRKEDKESVEREREQWSVFREMFMKSFGSVCKVKTQDPGNFHEEVKSLVTAW